MRRRTLLSPGVSIAGEANLIVAASDLKLVRLLRGAMAGRLSPGAGAPFGPAGAGISPRRQVEPRPLIEPRKRIEPEPRFEPRPVIRPEPRIEPPPCRAPLEPEMPVRSRSPIEPPWKVLAWEIPIPPAPKVKIITYRPDVVSKGSLIDFFI